MSELDHYLIGFGSLLAAAVVAVRIAEFIRLPDVVMLLLTGVALGPGLGWLRFDPGQVGVHFLIMLAAAYILFRGGMALELRVLRSIWITVTLLATVGVLVTAAVTAAAAAWLFGWAPVAALLLAAVIAATDPATLIPILEQVRVPDRLRQAIVAESALNDATAAILTLTVLGVALHPELPPDLGQALREAAWMAAGGVAVGIATGVAIGLLVWERGWLAGHSGPLVLGAVLFVYGGSEALGVSGFMAVFTAGVLVGNLQYRHLRPAAAAGQRADHYLDITGHVFRMLLFVLLGSELDLRVLGTRIVPALLLAAIFILVARPLAVLLCALPDRSARWNLSELVFMGWARETGVIPAALVGVVVAARPAHASVLPGIVAIVVLVTILVQGSTAGLLAARLRLTRQALA